MINDHAGDPDPANEDENELSFCVGEDEYEKCLEKNHEMYDRDVGHHDNASDCETLNHGGGNDCGDQKRKGTRLKTSSVSLPVEVLISFQSRKWLRAEIRKKERRKK